MLIHFQTISDTNSWHVTTKLGVAGILLKITISSIVPTFPPFNVVPIMSLNHLGSIQHWNGGEGERRRGGEDREGRGGEGERDSVTDNCLGRANNFVNDCMLFKWRSLEFMHLESMFLCWIMFIFVICTDYWLHAPWVWAHHYPIWLSILIPQLNSLSCHHWSFL